MSVLSGEKDIYTFEKSHKSCLYSSTLVDAVSSSEARLEHRDYTGGDLPESVLTVF